MSVACFGNSERCVNLEGHMLECIAMDFSDTLREAMRAKDDIALQGNNPVIARQRIVFKHCQVCEGASGNAEGQMLLQNNINAGATFA